ncbi:MAG: FAD-binding and (Fe-S)-binding domain-containing protein, partial [Phycisphaerales bacterium]
AASPGLGEGGRRVSLTQLAPDAFPDAPAAAALRAVPDLDTRFGRHDRLLYATDASLYQVEPLGVVVPRTVAALERAVTICAAHAMPILPRAGGTSLAGQAVNRAVVIDTSRHLRAIHDVDVEHRRVRVEPGVVLDHLNEELAARGTGLFFGPDVATSAHACIGGMMGNNSAGARSILYGRTVEHVLGIDAVLCDAEGHAVRLRFDEGAATRDERVRAISERVAKVVRRNAPQIRERFPKTTRRVDGYNLDLILDQVESGGVEAMNLAKLLVGSEGTLAVTACAELNLVPAAAARALAVIAYPTLRDAVENVVAILDAKPSAVELLDDMIISLAQRNPEHARNVELLPHIDGRPPGAVLYVEAQTEGEASDLDRTLERICAAAPGRSVHIHRTQAEMTRAWALRKAGEPLLHGLPGNRKPITFIEDTAVDPGRLARFVEAFRQLCERHGTTASFYAHASVGCLHIRPLLDPHDVADRERMLAIAQEATDLVRAHGGALSGEHGDGRARSPLLERFYGDELMEAFREIKRIFDPRNLCNPGNIVGPHEEPDMLRDFRVAASKAGEHAVASVDTFYDYTEQGGFLHAVEQCNGAGVCRKTRSGTMCPSYRALRDERHATRGRGNALRLAITGQYPEGLRPAGEPRWDDPDTVETLDLCLSCKACKAECPSNVDIAKLKAEYTGQRNRRRALPPVRDLAMGNVRTLMRIASVAPGVVNAVNRSALFRLIANPAGGLAKQRSLPPVGRSVEGWFRSRTCAGDRPRVGVFHDCFTGYGEGSIAKACGALLESFGYEPVLVSAGCCGRPFLSLGLLEQARRQIEATGARLDRALRDERLDAMLVLEPSCLSAFCDDWLSLKSGLAPEVRRRIAGCAVLPEQFLDERWDEHPRRPELAGTGAEALLHTHCHQKALEGPESSARFLRRLAGENIRVLDAGCCGMAGAFGYKKATYDLSVAVGEIALAPAVRAAPEATVCASGTSCRHQVRDLTGRRALHPVELAASLVGAHDPEPHR